MKLAIVCANINSIDHVQGIPRQKVDYDYYYFNENNLPFPLPNLNPRMRSKYIKIMMHRFLQQYDAYIWIDGKVQVLQNNFAELMIKNLEGNDVAIFKHQERKTPLEEIEFIETHMKNGSKYVLSRYGNQQIEKEKEWFVESMPLYETTLFARLNNDKVNYQFEQWWHKTIEYSCFDQAMFSYIAGWLNVDVLDREKFKDTFIINKHR